MKKLLSLLLFASLLIKPLSIVSAQRINDATQDISNPEIIEKMALRKSITRYYSRSVYNIDIYSPRYNPFPTVYNYNDGVYRGQLPVTNWYISPSDYVVTYSGLIGPYAPLSIIEVE